VERLYPWIVELTREIRMDRDQLQGQFQSSKEAL